MKNNLPNTFKKAYWLTLILFFIGNGIIIYAQTKTISGNVTSKDGPLPGVTVIVENTTTGAVTDFDGNYTIEASSDANLIFNYIGYETQKIEVGNQAKIDIYLKEDVSSLDEVVVIGYGTVAKKDLTGSVVSLKAEDFEKQQAVSFENAIQGKAAGVQITTAQGGPGEGLKIKVRGGTSISANNDPLYVIDGFPISGEAINNSTGLGTTASSPLATIDPANIESIEILKDASATAIYGSRGANGVVIITTKSGRNQKMTLEFDTETGLQRTVRHLDLLSPEEFIAFQNEAFPWNPGDPNTRFQQQAFRDDLGNDIPLGAVDEDGLPILAVRDWRDELFRDAVLTKHRVGVRGGIGKTWLSAAFSLTDQEGVIDTSDFRRYALNINFGANISDKLTVGMNFNGGRNENNGVVTASTTGGGSNLTSGVISNFVSASPVQGRRSRIQSDTDVVVDEDGFVTQIGIRQIVNPTRLVQETLKNDTANSAYFNTFLEYEIMPGLKFRSSFGSNFFYSKNKSYFPRDFGWGQTAGGRAFVNTFQAVGWTNDNLLTLDRNFGNHKINAVLGFTQQKNTGERLATGSTGFATDVVNVDDLSAGEVFNAPQSSRTQNTLLSYLARINYTFLGKYTMNLTGRYDGSSRFSAGEPWGFFPAVGVNWNMGEESWLKNVGFISNWKWRASYGITGNNGIGDFRSLGTVATNRRSGNGFINASSIRAGSVRSGFVVNQLENPDLTWETTRAFDAAIEVGFFKNRINAEIIRYTKDTEDLLLEQPTPASSGFDRVARNVGKVRNDGWEFTISTTNINTDNFSWKTDFNISYNENEVVSLGTIDGGQFPVTAQQGGFINNDFIVKEGESLGSVFGYENDGLYTYDDFTEFDGLNSEEREALYRAGSQENLENGIIAPSNGDTNQSSFTLKEGVVRRSDLTTYRPGIVKRKDLNGDGLVDQANDRKIIGNTLPLHIGGITNTFRYKSIDFSIFFNWSYGNDIYNKNLYRGTDGINVFGNKFGIVRDRWTPQNTNTNVPSLGGRIRVDGTNASDFFIEDGSYLRLNNITLGYTIPANQLSKVGLSSLRFFTSVDNVYVWTDYSGYDPDVSVGWGNNAQLTPGVDFDAYPRARSFRIGLQAKF